MKRVSRRTRNYIILIILLMGLWLLLSGMYDLFHTSMGVISVTAVVWLDRKLLQKRFFPPHRKEPPRLRVIYLHYSYFPWLFWQIITSALHVAWVILSPKNIDTSLLFFKTKLPTNTGKVILANSITLTPGTLTIDLSDDEFLVHALTRQSAEGIRSGDFPSRSGKLYGLDPQGFVSAMKIIQSADEI